MAAATPWYLDLSTWLAVVKVFVALGMIIFVHELGHFVVAKLCGVKCEKFYLGFDIFGWKFCKFTWGETEYGIGLLPLGGYVKMLGQEDNPARLKEELERAKQQQADDKPPEKAEEESAKKGEASDTKDKKDSGEEVDIKAVEAALYDPRSYLAQSVPKRMAIISAGVIMNLIFACVCAAIAFGLGVKQAEPVIGGVLPGKGAWTGDAEKGPIQVGDRYLEIGGKKCNKFRDVREGIAFGDNVDQGIEMLLQRPGVEKPIEFKIVPSQGDMVPLMGIFSASTTTLRTKVLVANPNSAAARCSPKLQFGDKILEIDGAAIKTQWELQRYLATYPDKELTLTLERSVKAKDAPADEPAVTKKLDAKLGTNPMWRLGLIMGMGEISAVQYRSPAARARIKKNGKTIQIKAGDRIVKIDDEAPGDPMTLGSRLNQRAGETIQLTIERVTKTKEDIAAKRKGRSERFIFSIKSREVDWLETPETIDTTPITLPSLGIAYHVTNRVVKPMAGFPVAAAKKHPQPGDKIIAATIIPPTEEKLPDPPVSQSKLDLDLDDDENQNWVLLVYLLQGTLKHTEVELTWIHDEKEMTGRFGLKADDQWLNPVRGLYFEPLTFLQKAETFGEAVKLGADEALHSTLLVYRFLQKIGSQISPKAMGGPISIFIVAKQHADQGTSQLLLFLTMLSANLAVVNFLPIPLLDGGHMVFLTWEGIRGKPPSENIQLRLTYFGLAFILSLMLWVFYLDIGRLLVGF